MGLGTSAQRSVLVTGWRERRKPHIRRRAPLGISAVAITLLLTACGTPQDDLFRAARSGEVAAARNAIAAKVDVNAKRDGETPLIAASAACQLGIVNVLLASGAKLNEQGRDRSFHFMAPVGSTPLMAAARQSGPNCTSVAKRLINAGADVNVQDPDGRSALYSAALNGQLDTVRLLLAAGADIDGGPGAHDTPLDGATLPDSIPDQAKPRAEVAKLLRELGGTQRERWGQNP
ncbi:MAG TPA: ankyrin repeat domain-containing protein [Caulobacteraceae bacterium]|jgi:ankyrin repeat protein